MTEIANPIDKAVAVRMLDKPETPVEILPDNAGVKIGDHRPWWRRVYDSMVVRVQGLSVVLCTVVLALPSDVLAAAIPPKYAATGILIFNIITTLARMRTL